MRRCGTLILFGLVIAAGLQIPAHAQVPISRFSRSFSFGGQSQFNRPSIQSRPAFSPYLNLLRGGNSTLLNYYGLVRPELAFRRADSQLQYGIGQLQSDLGNARRNLAGSSLPVSGHRVTFQSDLRGGAGSVSQALSTRQSRMQTLPVNPNSSRLPTGHGVYFGNQGGFYRTIRR